MFIYMYTTYRELLTAELESVGIRLNKRKPNIYFKVRHGIIHGQFNINTAWNENLNIIRQYYPLLYFPVGLKNIIKTSILMS